MRKFTEIRFRIQQKNASRIFRGVRKVCGHLDYAIRYAPNMDRNYCGADYQDIMDAILKLLLERFSNTV